MNKAFLAILPLLAGLSLPSTAQSPVYVTELSLDNLTSIYNFNEINGTTYFTQFKPNIEFLWRTDGTTANTQLLDTIYANCVNCSLHSMVVLNNNLVFSHNNGTSGITLFRTNPTISGFEEIPNPTNKPFYPAYLTLSGNKIFFDAYTNDTGKELWATDGTAAGTYLVKDLEQGIGNSEPANLIDFNGELYFTTYYGTNGYDLYKSDGTAAGTVGLKDIAPDGANPPKQLIPLNNQLFFTVDDGINGEELWKTDGTAAGTVMVKDIIQGNSGAYPMNLTASGNYLYFMTENSKLWRTDGTEAGTVMLRDFLAVSDFAIPHDLIDYNGTLYLLANNDYDDFWQLWKTDGTPAGTVLVRQENREGVTYHTRLFQGKLFFGAPTESGYQIWQSDGTSNGTFAVTYIPSDAIPYYWEVSANKLYYITSSQNSTKLWYLPSAVTAQQPAITAHAGFSIFPNPAMQQATLSLTAFKPGTILELSDLTGRSITAISVVQPQQQIDLSKLPAGVYIAKLKYITGKSASQLFLVN